jgi:hypothetical protein
MYASGLKIGFTTRDMLDMPVNRLVNILSSLNPDGKAEEPVREATQADINALR